MITQFSVGCIQNNESNIGAANLKRLKAKYDPEVINYFYETVFHEDFSQQKRTNISKWNTNPIIVVLGKPSTEEREYVQKAVSVINELDLPVKCTLGRSGDSSSIDVYFGNYQQVCAHLNLDSVSKSDVDTSDHFGVAKTISYDGAMHTSHIGIYYTNNHPDHDSRYKVVLEEIIQSLGVVGDSYNYPGSLFFENYNPEKSLTKLDVDVLSMLYEPSIPANYPIESFENDFSHELNIINTESKIKALLDQYPKVSHNDIEKCFSGAILLKHPKEIPVYLYGTPVDSDSAFMALAISSINQINPAVQIRLSKPTDIEPDHGIIIRFKKLIQQKERLKRTNDVIVGRSCMFQKIIKNRVLLSFNTEEINERFRQRSLVDALYYSLVQIPQEQTKTNPLFELNNGNINFSPRYANLLKLVYSNEFPDGYKLDKFRALTEHFD